MAPRILVVPPSFAEVAEIANRVAPGGFEIKVVRNDRAEIEAAARQAEYIVCFPACRRGTRSFARRRGSSSTTPERGLRRGRSRGGAARQGAGLQQRRRQCHLGRRARDDADARRVAPGHLAARQRLRRALARQRAGAAHVRDFRQDARHRRPRHHRQEGGAARQGVRHAGAVLRHRAAARARRGCARRPLPPAARGAVEVRRRHRCTCRSTTAPAT